MDNQKGHGLRHALRLLAQDRLEKKSFFNWFYFAINWGSCIAVTVIVYIQVLAVYWPWRIKTLAHVLRRKSCMHACRM